MTRLKVMTWNILHHTGCEEEHDHPWAQRAPAVRAVVESQRPDILCLQEAWPHQVDSLLENLPDHWWFGRDRHGGNQRESCPIVYDSTRVKPLEWQQMWLGSDPDKPGSLTWVNDVPRILVWARFEVYETGQRFYVANTHMDHLVPTTRTKSINLLQDRLPPGTPEEPLILCGDFNSPAWSKPHRLLSRGPDRFHDTFWTARQRERFMQGTFHKFTGKGWARFDWILTRPRLETHRLRILRDTPGGTYPSDHFPVVAELELPQPLRADAWGGAHAGARAYAEGP